VTEALPEAEPLAAVCATALTVNSAANIAAIQNFFMFVSVPFVLLGMKIRGRAKRLCQDSDAIFRKNVYSLG
jgi:hypothetical protein